MVSADKHAQLVKFQMLLMADVRRLLILNVTTKMKLQQKYLKETFFFLLICQWSKRLNYVNHARRLADGDWTGSDSDPEEDMEKQEEGEQQQDGSAEEEGMEIERRKLPKHYANQVSVWCAMT